MLKVQYNIPNPEPDGSFTVVFWNFGDGYQEDKDYTDRLCFYDMKTKKRCIEKERIFTIQNNKNYGTTFTANNEYYKLNENGEVKNKS